jgi:molybdate transport system substrate-binding protein
LLTRLIEDRDAGHADLYLPADESYIQAGRQRGLLAETIPVARMRPVLAVAAGNPKKIASLDDLLRPDVRLAMADPDVAAVGKVTRDALTRSGRWDAIKPHVAVSKPTVTDVANAIQLGAVDAGFVWDASVRQVGGLEVVPLPQLGGVSSTISVAVVAGCRQPAAALRFARFLAARDRGLPEFEKNGFEPAAGDSGEEAPEVVLYAGAMLRPAVEQTVKDFERREGVRVVTVYNGCGILVSQMRTRGERPDAYFACDKSFMDMVSDLFVDAEDVSTNRLVILVKKGNPHGIKALDDLGQPGLRVGVGHEKQCALGVLTQKALEQGRAKADVMKNVKTQLPAGDMLVNDMLAGALDAVVAYVSNKTGHDDELEAIPIDVPCALAVQPVAVGRESKHRQLTQRLLAALRSAESRQRFEANGFHWRAGSEQR